MCVSLCTARTWSFSTSSHHGCHLHVWLDSKPFKNHSVRFGARSRSFCHGMPSINTEAQVSWVENMDVDTGRWWMKSKIHLINLYSSFPRLRGPAGFTGPYVLGLDESGFQMAGISFQCLLKLCYRVVDSILRQYVRLRCSLVSLCLYVSVVIAMCVQRASELKPCLFFYSFVSLL